jgi:hypothetical protein
VPAPPSSGQRARPRLCLAMLVPLDGLHVVGARYLTHFASLGGLVGARHLPHLAAVSGIDTVGGLRMAGALHLLAVGFVWWVPCTCPT